MDKHTIIEVTNNVNPRKPFIETPLAGAIAAGVFTLLAVVLGYWLSTRAIQPESYDVTVRASEYPLSATNIKVNEGDQVEIQVLGANTVILNCGLGKISPIGMIENENQKAAIYPSANLCALIGRIGEGPYFVVGAYYKAISDMTGKLILGVNDVGPESCGYTPPELCYKDNLGGLSVKVNVIRRR
jgi:hypothetical protein